MNTSILGNAAHNQLDPTVNLDKALEIFNQPPIQVNVRPNPMMVNPNAPVEEQADVNVQGQTNSGQEPVEEGEQPPSEATEGDEGEPLAPEFAEAFKQYFGVEPTEALETVNQLVAFRDEMTLMRQWGVSPVEYDTRMGAVREFYNNLPEDGRDQFNTIEGAAAIWEHLQKQGQAPATTTKRTSSNKPASRIKQASTPKQEFLKKSDILRMDAAKYRDNLPQITKAFREGRVILDA
jgi:hypothetical protein